MYISTDVVSTIISTTLVLMAVLTLALPLVLMAVLTLALPLVCMTVSTNNH